MEKDFLEHMRNFVIGIFCAIVFFGIAFTVMLTYIHESQKTIIEQNEAIKNELVLLNNKLYD